MTPTINNTDQQYHESPTRHAIMKAEMVRWYREQRRQMAEQLRRIYGREN
nr:MAG TPA: hypothetical protein [Caudoviricetes sp.]